MALVTVRPTNTDISIARAVAAHTNPRAEKIAEGLTWGADEHILCALAAGWWIYTRDRSENQRRAANHILITTLVSSALPHLLKNVFDQERPDRLTVRGGALVLTRVVLLAHWASDVVVGLLVGTCVERMLRPVTGYGRPSLERARRKLGAKRISCKGTN
jgi:hypothetical protein